MDLKQKKGKNGFGSFLFFADHALMGLNLGRHVHFDNCTWRRHFFAVRKTSKTIDEKVHFLGNFGWTCGLAAISTWILGSTVLFCITQHFLKLQPLSVLCNACAGIISSWQRCWNQQSLIPLKAILPCSFLDFLGIPILNGA